MMNDHPILTNVHHGHLIQIKWLDNTCFIQLLLTRARGKGKKYPLSLLSICLL